MLVTMSIVRREVLLGGWCVTMAELVIPTILRRYFRANSPHFHDLDMFLAWYSSGVL